jgi:ribosome-associated protein
MSNIRKLAPKKLVDFVTKHLDELQAEDIKVISVKKLTNVTDYLVICSGNSLRHIHMLGEQLVPILKHHGISILGVEDDPSGTWVLIDLNVAIVHIMDPKTREFYALEKLWSVHRK